MAGLVHKLPHNHVLIYIYVAEGLRCGTEKYHTCFFPKTLFFLKRSLLDSGNHDMCPWNIFVLKLRLFCRDIFFTIAEKNPHFIYFTKKILFLIYSLYQHRIKLKNYFYISYWRILAIPSYLFADYGSPI